MNLNSTVENKWECRRTNEPVSKTHFRNFDKVLRHREAEQLVMQPHFTTSRTNRQEGDTKPVDVSTDIFPGDLRKQKSVSSLDRAR